MEFSISVDKINDNMNIIDIRDEYQYKQGHIANAYLIPKEKLLGSPELYLTKYNVYYLYCNFGIQSMKVCRMLKEQGYQVISIDGGFMEYKSRKR